MVGHRLVGDQIVQHRTVGHWIAKHRMVGGRLVESERSKNTQGWLEETRERRFQDAISN